MRARFLGLTVKEYDQTLDFNGQSSSLRLGLVADAAAGDAPDVPDLGSPVTFQHAGFTFGGLLQRFEEIKSPAGNPVYEATVVDPREILSGAKVVTGGWAGTAPAGVKNVLNAYGYWESFGFGESGSTQAGMPWQKVISAVVAMANAPAGTPYGGMLEWAGARYGLDLRELPRAPNFYRAPAGTASLLELVSQLCEDAAADFWVELVGLTVTVRVDYRTEAVGGMGYVKDVAASAAFDGLVAALRDGAEMTAEPTAAVVVGGAKTGLHITEDFWSYWGTDIAGRPVVGTPGVFEPFGACEFADINALDCADVLGQTFYHLSTWECRFALWGREGWDLFVSTHRPDLATKLGMVGHGGRDAGEVLAVQLPFDTVNDNPDNLALGVQEQLVDRQERLFDLVRRAAEEFYGKQYVAVVPGVSAKRDPDTGAVTTNLEPASAGYLRFGAAALGVPPTSLDILQEADERVVPFRYHESVLDADTSQLNFGDTAVDAAGRAWTKGQVMPRLLLLPDGTFGVHVKFGGALYGRREDDFGDVTEIGRCFGPNVGAADIQEAAGNQLCGSMGYLGLHPPALEPDAIGVPLKSNTETYGPWYVGGPAGAVRVEQDESLTPWDQGGEEAMFAAGAARAAAAAGRNWAASGSITAVGLPAYSPGDVVRPGGPKLTRVSVRYGAQGVSTEYSWQSLFTPRWGTFQRQNAERLKRAALAAVELRRSARVALNKALVAGEVRERAFRGSVANRAFWEKHQSPNNVLLAKGVPAAGAAAGTVRPAVGAENFESALRLQQQGGHSSVAMMSMDGLVRGFTTSQTSASKLPKTTVPDGLGGLTATNLSFVKADNDIEVLGWGEQYAGAHARRRGNDPANTRAMALRGPLWVAGWGYGLDTNPVPGPGGGAFVGDYLRRSDLWKVGPLDPLWDQWRGVWSVHDLVDGVTVAAVAAGGTGTVRVGGQAGRTLTVRNRWSVSIPANRQVVCGYIQNRHEWQVIAANCA